MPTRRRSPVPTSARLLTPAQVDVWLGLAVVGAVTTGLVSWGVGTGWSRWWTVAHAVCGLAVLALAPAKARGSARTGLRRRRASRWVSIGFGAMVVAVAGLGLVHATGLWYGVGYWSALWTHELLAFLTIPLLAWHVLSRPGRARAVDLDRRMLLGGAAAAGMAAVAVGAVEGASRVGGLAGGSRRFTGSHELGSFDPDAMPSTVWIDDRTPDTDVEAWTLRISGVEVDLAELRDRARPLEAALDCTGGWYSVQSWDTVPIAELLDPPAGFPAADSSTSGSPGPRATDPRSFVVTSATGYARIFPWRDAADVHLAIGYGGRPLRRRHGAPVRLVAPGRRGPWWIKWVTDIETSERPWWLQAPFPTT